MHALAHARIHGHEHTQSTANARRARAYALLVLLGRASVVNWYAVAACLRCCACGTASSAKASMCEAPAAPPCTLARASSCARPLTQSSRPRSPSSSKAL
eukprot:6134586-Pleurochrysis_carterae.AAC.1